MKFYLIICPLAVLLFSCSYQKIEFEKQSGKTNTIKKGDKFCVWLPEDHTTLYLWSVDHNYDKKTLSYIQSVFHGKSVAFNFEAANKGKTEITFYLYSYKDTSQVKTFLVEVE